MTRYNENLPPVEEMREQVEVLKEHQVASDIYATLDRYKELFNRWKGGEELSFEEVREMTTLGEKLESIRNQMN